MKKRNKIEEAQQKFLDERTRKIETYLIKKSQKESWKLFEVNIGWFNLNKVDYPRSTAGSMRYLVSAATKEDAEKIVLKKFKEKDPLCEKITVYVNLLKLPKFVSLNGAGIINLY